jgi:hypothetical protein
MKTWNKKQLIKRWEEKRKDLINPDNFTSWDDLGFDEAPEGYESIDDYLETDPEIEHDEREQITLEIIDEILDDLRKLKE